MPFEGARGNDPGLPTLHADRLAASNTITPPRRHALWRDHREVGEAAVLAILMCVGGGVAGALIAAVLLNERLLIALGLGSP